LMIRSEDFLGHAIHATKITPVGDGNSQVAQGAVESISKSHGKLGGSSSKLGENGLSSSV